MDFADHHERTEADRVSAFIRALAIAMMVLGIVFGVLDGSGLLPQLPTAAVAHDSAANAG